MKTARTILILVLIALSNQAWGVNCFSTSITLSTQLEVDDFQVNYGGGGICDTVPGSLFITGADITNLDGLSDLTNIASWLFIENNPLLNSIDGLGNLVTVDRFRLQNNASLADIDGLTKLTDITGALEIGENPLLTNINGVASLTTVGDIYLYSNAILNNVDSLINLTTIGGVYISSNPALSDIGGLANLSSATYGVQIVNNNSLTDLDGLANLTNAGELYLQSNGNLTDLSGLTNLTTIAGVLSIYYQHNLIDLNGLANLSNLGGAEIVSNDNLINIDGLTNITSLSGDLIISENNSLANINGLSNVTDIGGGLRIQFNHTLLNLDGLIGLHHTGGFLRIWGNDALTNINGLVHIISVGDELVINSNYNLENCTSLVSLLGWPSGPPDDSVVGAISIGSNFTGCNSVQEVLDSVSGPTSPMITSVVATIGQAELSFSPAITSDVLWPITGYQSQCLSAETAVDNDTVMDIPDEGSVVSSVNLSGVSYQNAAGLNILVNITHPRTRHLTLTLVSPTGTSVILWDEAVGDGENLVGTFPTTLEPAESLSALDDEDLNGEWQLTVADGVASYTGTLNSWGITIRDKLTSVSETSPITVIDLSSNLLYSCTVSAVSGLGVGPASNDVMVNCLTDTCTAETFTVGGSVSGLNGTGLVLQNNANDDLNISQDGEFVFETPLVNGITYAVTVLSQPGNPSQTCSVIDGSGTLTGADITSITITCTTNTFTVGGNVSGLFGNGLVLQNNADDELVIAGNGSFTFSTSLEDLSTYAVTVWSQPVNPSQTCSVTGSSGTLSGNDVTDVIVSCTTYCNVNLVPDTVEYSEAVYEACETLVIGPNFIAVDGATISVSSGWEIEFLPGFIVEQGATLNANVCGQSLCMTSDTPMPYGCHSCIDQICDIDAFCCSSEFDRLCANMVEAVCGLICE